MAGQQDARGCRTRQSVQHVEGPQVVTEVPVVRDHRGAAAEHGVTREQGPVRRQQEAQRVGRMPGARDDPQLTPSRRNHIPTGQPLPAEPVRGSAARTAALVSSDQPPCAARMVAVPVGKQDQCDPFPGPVPAQPPGARVPRPPDPDQPRRPCPQEGSPITQVLVPSRVMGEGLGASRHVARGVRNWSIPGVGGLTPAPRPARLRRPVALGRPGAWPAWAARPRRSPWAAGG